MSIEAMLFDLGNVIVDLDTVECEATLVKHSDLNQLEWIGTHRTRGWIARYERGELTTSEFHRLLSNGVGLRMNLGDFSKTWSSVFKPVPILPTSLLSSLASRYAMTLISNTNEAHASYIRKNYDVLDCFEHEVLSYEVGALKPESRIFQIAIETTGRSPENVLFIDDQQENICAGQAMGLKTHWFRSASGLRQAFLELGIQADWPPDRLSE